MLRQFYRDERQAQMAFSFEILLAHDKGLNRQGAVARFEDYVALSSKSPWLLPEIAARRRRPWLCRTPPVANTRQRRIARYRQTAIAWSESPAIDPPWPGRAPCGRRCFSTASGCSRKLSFAVTSRRDDAIFVSNARRKLTPRCLRSAVAVPFGILPGTGRWIA